MATFSDDVSIASGALLRSNHDVTSDTTLTRDYYNVTVSDSGGNVVITLPAAASYTGVEFRIAKRAGNNLTTIQAQAGELIGGIANIIPVPLLTSITVESVNGGWQMVESPLEPNVRDVTATTSLVVGDFNITVSDTAGNVTLNLPSATNYSLIGRKLYLHKRAGTNTTTIDPAGSETIDSETIMILPYQGSIVLQSDLTSWRSVSRSFVPQYSADPVSWAAGQNWWRTDTSKLRVGLDTGVTAANIVTESDLSTIQIPASAFAPFATGGATAVTTTLATTLVPIDEYSFSASVSNRIAFKVTLPPGWNGTTLTARFNWRTTSASANDVKWQIVARYVGNGVSPDVAFGTAATVTDTNTGAEYLNISGNTGTITPSGSFVSGCSVHLVVFRDPTDGSDTLASAALLDDVILTWK